MDGPSRCFPLMSLPVSHMQVDVLKPQIFAWSTHEKFTGNLKGRNRFEPSKILYMPPGTYGFNALSNQGRHIFIGITPLQFGDTISTCWLNKIHGQGKNGRRFHLLATNWSPLCGFSDSSNGYTRKNKCPMAMWNSLCFHLQAVSTQQKVEIGHYISVLLR